MLNNIIVEPVCFYSSNSNGLDLHFWVVRILQFLTDHNHGCTKIFSCIIQCTRSLLEYHFLVTLMDQIVAELLVLQNKNDALICHLNNLEATFLHQYRPDFFTKKVYMTERLQKSVITSQFAQILQSYSPCKATSLV